MGTGFYCEEVAHGGCPTILNVQKTALFAVIFGTFFFFFFKNVGGSNFLDFQYFSMKFSQKCRKTFILAFLMILKFLKLLEFGHRSHFFKIKLKTKNEKKKKKKKKKQNVEKKIFDQKKNLLKSLESLTP